MSTPRVHYPWYKKEDTDAFFALFQNNIANFVIIAISMLGMGFPAEIVFGQVLPGAAVAVKRPPLPLKVRLGSELTLAPERVWPVSAP